MIIETPADALDLPDGRLQHVLSESGPVRHVPELPVAWDHVIAAAEALVSHGDREPSSRAAVVARAASNGWLDGERQRYDATSMWAQAEAFDDGPVGGWMRRLAAQSTVVDGQPLGRLRLRAEEDNRMASHWGDPQPGDALVAWAALDAELLVPGLRGRWQRLATEHLGRLYALEAAGERARLWPELEQLADIAALPARAEASALAGLDGLMQGSRTVRPSSPPQQSPFWPAVDAAARQHAEDARAASTVEVPSQTALRKAVLDDLARLAPGATPRERWTAAMVLIDSQLRLRTGQPGGDGRTSVHQWLILAVTDRALESPAPIPGGRTRGTATGGPVVG